MGNVAHNLKRFLASRKGQIMFNIIYSWGAAVVILGVMFKIMHFPGGDWILMAGMIVEVLVFIAAGLDYSSYDVPSSDGGQAGVIIGGGSAITPAVEAIPSNKNKMDKQTMNQQGSVVVIAGDSRGGVVNSASVGTQTIPGDQQSAHRAFDPGVAQSLDDTSKKIEDISKQLSGTHEFAENLATLNENIKGLNDVFNGQLQTITEQMSAIRYINDSLQRMKNLYDGAIGDSYMFREETAKMTKHIEALNNVYARLLQAMTTNNNNNNMNPNNF